MALDDLATAIGVTTAELRGYEAGTARPTPDVLSLIYETVRLRPSIPLAWHARDVLAVAEQCGVRDVRVFGSVVHGRDTEDSDIDLLISLATGTTLFDLGRFALEVEQRTGFPVDLLTDDDLASNPHFSHVLDDAVPL